MPKTIAPEVISAAKKRLQSLPQKPKTPKPVPLSEAIRQIKSEVQAALKRGYTFDEIAQALKEDGIEVGTPTLKSYVYKKGNKPRAFSPVKATTTTTAPPSKSERTGSKAVEMPKEL